MAPADAGRLADRVERRGPLVDGQTLLRAEVEGARQVETLVGWGTDPRTLYVARAPRAFGLTISPPLLLRTDQVIE